MKKLEFPVMTGQLPEKRQLSMDDYLEFVLFNLRYTCDLKANRKLKRQLAVKMPFSLKPAN